jgi:hypothetical protein
MVVLSGTPKYGRRREASAFDGSEGIVAEQSAGRIG